MRSCRFLFLALVGWALLGAAATAAAPPLSYVIEVELDPVTHRLTGREVVRWTNTSSVTTDELRLHLYLNAFASNATTFMRELGGGTLRSGLDADLEWGWIEVDRLLDDGGTDLLPGLEFVRPDDGNPDDFTVARVALAEPAPPGAVVVLDLAFTAQLPSIVARTGHAGDFHLVGQWFPKLGVLEAAGWSCHQFHANSEFYADFATYDVTVTVPAGWVVAGAGVEAGRSPLEGGRERVRFRAEQVHDFAWSAAPPELMMVVDAELDPALHVPAAWLVQAAADLDRSPAELAVPPLYLRLMVPREQAALVPRMTTAARAAVAWLGLNLGLYPYPQITLVSPPPAAFEAWGMEYPTLVTTGASRLMARPPLDRLAWIEEVTAHELAHQYFQGLVASNEAEAAWLDEGLTAWAENRIVEAMTEAGLIATRSSLSPWARSRAEAAAGGLPVRPDRPSWTFRRRGDYFRASYARTAVALRTLEGLVGRDTVARGLRSYVDRHRFTHPRGEDLFAALGEAAGSDLAWFFDQTIRGDAEVDWAVLAARSWRDDRPDGLVWDGAGWVAPDADGTAGEGVEHPWQVEVEIGRRGDLVGPVEVRLRFADGSEQWRRWDGRDRWVRWRVEAPSPLAEVAVDPRAVWALEGKRGDNYWCSAEAACGGAGRQWWLGAAVTALVQGGLPW